MPSKPLQNAHKATALTLMALALSLTGCATPLPPAPLTPVQIPAPPPLTEPTPPVSYSLSVRALLQTWQQRLTASTPTD